MAYYMYLEIKPLLFVNQQALLAKIHYSQHVQFELMILHVSSFKIGLQRQSFRTLSKQNSVCHGLEFPMK